MSTGKILWAFAYAQEIAGGVELSEPAIPTHLPRNSIRSWVCTKSSVTSEEEKGRKRRLQSVSINLLWFHFQIILITVLIGFHNMDQISLWITTQKHISHCVGNQAAACHRESCLPNPRLFRAGAGILQTLFCFGSCSLQDLWVAGARRRWQGQTKDRRYAPSWPCFACLGFLWEGVTLYKSRSAEYHFTYWYWLVRFPFSPFHSENEFHQDPREISTTCPYPFFRGLKYDYTCSLGKHWDCFRLTGGYPHVHLDMLTPLNLWLNHH